MAAESIWKVRPAARKFETDTDLLIPSVRHPLEDTEETAKLAEFWTRWENKKANSKQSDDKEKYDFEDPLGATFGDAETGDQVDIDVLQQSTKASRSFSLDNTLENRRTDRSTFDVELPDFQPWRAKRAQIALLAKPKEYGMSQIDMLKARLKSLTDEKSLKSGKKAEDISQKFLTLRENLLTAWTREDRVEAFRIIVECNQLLQSTPVNSEEYPYYWLLTIDVIDTFGKLLHDRLLSKSNEARNKNGQTDLPVNFNVEQVPKNVKDMATNWFLKLSEIVDVPVRFYIECSMIACLKFFDETKIAVNLERLACMCAQFPNDLSSVLARVHISRYSMLIDPLNRAPHWRVLHDWMQAPKNVMEDKNRKKVALADSRRQEVSIQAIAWIVQCIAHRASTVEDLVPLFAYCRKAFPLDQKTFILISAVIEGLPSKYLAVHSEQVLDIVFALREEFEGPLTRLGKRFFLMPPVEENRKFVKNRCRSVWMRVADVASFQTFVECCTAWTAFTAKYYTLKDIVSILELVQVRLRMDDQTKKEENTTLLLDLIASFIDFTAEKEDCLDIVINKDFIKIVDLIGFDIQSTSDCSRKILEILTKQFEKHSISNVAVCQLIIEKCHSMCKAFRLEDSSHVQMIEQLVCSSLSLIDFQSITDMNQCIELVVRCREDMGLRQTILAHVINILLGFTQFAHSSLKTGKRKADFMRVCITNLSVTIPAIRDAQKRIIMTIQNIQMCLLVNFLPQIQLSNERILDYLNEISTKISSPCAVISPLMNKYLSVLCYCPDGFSEDSPSLATFSKLLDLVERNHEEWSKEGKGIPLSEIYINMLRYLCNSRRVDFLTSDGSQDFHIGDVEHFKLVDANISNVITKLFSLANEPTVAVITLENIVMLFEIHEEMRSTIRGLLKRSVGAPPHLEKRLDAIVQDLRDEAEYDESVKNILQKLSLL